MERDKTELFTLFVDNIPDSKNQSWLKILFSSYGIVKDSFIPAKRSKRGSRFGFVRFDCSVSAGVAISRANGLEVEGYFLFVKKASFDLQNKRKTPGATDSSKPREVTRQNNMDFKVENGKSYAQALKGRGQHGSILVHPIGNGWLYRSAIAKIRKLISTEEMEKVFRKENVRDVHIRAIGGRYVIITFPNEEIRMATIKERWVMNLFDEIKPWNGEPAKDERFVWLSCFGMPLSAWSSQTFKEIGGLWGHFLKVDDNTLIGKSYEKGKILIATEHIQKVEGFVNLIVDGRDYCIRVEEEESFRTIASSTSCVDLLMDVTNNDVDLDQKSDDAKRGRDDLVASNDVVDAFSGMVWPGLALDQNHSIPDCQSTEFGVCHKTIEEGNDEDTKCSERSSPVVPATQDSSGEKVMNEGNGLDVGNSLETLEVNHCVINDDGPFVDPIVEKCNPNQDDVWDLVSNEPLIKFVECRRKKKSHKSKKVFHRKALWSKNPLKNAMFSRTVSRDSAKNASRLGSKIGSDDSNVSIQEEVSCDTRMRNSTFIKEARENMKMSVRLGVKFHGRESYNIKKMLELQGIEISEQEIKAEVKALDILEGVTSSSVVF